MDLPAPPQFCKASHHRIGLLDGRLALKRSLHFDSVDATEKKISCTVISHQSTYSNVAPPSTELLQSAKCHGLQHQEPEHVKKQSASSTLTSESLSSSVILQPPLVHNGSHMRLGMRNGSGDLCEGKRSKPADIHEEVDDMHENQLSMMARWKRIRPTSSRGSTDTCTSAGAVVARERVGRFVPILSRCGSWAGPKL